MSETTHTDWLGNEYGVGDYVVYGAGSGRSINMVFAKVVEFKESGNVTLEPLKSSRWEQHAGSSFYIDERTGKRIDPWRAKQHVKSGGHYKHNVTGESITVDDYHNLDWRTKERENYTYFSTVFHDYVKWTKAPTKKVTLTVIQNITKWQGEIPDDLHSTLI
jgi:hypothetical protein